MQEETRIMSEDEVVNSSLQQGVSDVVQHSKKTLLRNIGLSGTGVASGSGLFLGLSKIHSETKDVETPVSEAETEVEEEVVIPPDTPSVPEHLHVATSVADNMNFSEAFAAARAEVGAGGYFLYHDCWYGTYYVNEWAAMSSDEKTQFSQAIYTHPNHEYYTMLAAGQAVPDLIIYDVAPVATWVHDDMTLADAHLTARAEVGPGGIFVYDGKTYSTYYPSELAQMNPQQHQQFIDSIDRADISNTYVPDSQGIQDIGELAIIEIDSEQLIYEPEDTTGMDTLVEGAILEEGYLDLGDNTIVYGEIIDTDNNGVPDRVRITNPETNEKIEIDVNEQTGDIMDIRSVDDAVDPSLLAYTSNNDFDPNADMQNWV